MILTVRIAADLHFEAQWLRLAHFAEYVPMLDTPPYFVNDDVHKMCSLE